MSLYSITPFAMEHKGNEAALHTPNGVFSVDDTHVVNLLKDLGLIGLTTCTELKDAIADSSKVNSVMDFLERDLGIIEEVSPLVDTLYLDATATERDLMYHIFAGLPLTENQTGNRQLVLCAVTDRDVAQSLTKARDELGAGNLLICLFPCRNEVIVTPPWRAGSGLPCPICCLDTLLDARFDGGRAQEVSLGDALIALRNEGFVPPPWQKLVERDLIFGARHAAARCESVLGRSSGWDIPGDIRHMLRIGLNQLEPHGHHIPLSPACNCLKNTFED